MSAPPLPDIFGNYALGDFVEVTSPAAIDWWPQTTGWALLGGVLAVLLLRRLWQSARRWYRDRYRREALARLDALGSAGTGMPAPGEVNQLLKLTALAAWSRERVARLSGPEWTEFLNRSCASPPFDATLAALLATGPYTSPSVDPETSRRLLQASRQWITEHRGPGDV
jgi:hypothetical protein